MRANAFVGVKDSQSLGSRVRGLFRNTAQALGFGKEPAESQRDDPEKIALDNVARNLTVNREDVPSVMTIAFSSKDPVKAATIVNAIVDTYIDANIASKDFIDQSRRQGCAGARRRAEAAGQGRGACAL